MPRTTIHDVAKAAGTSITTVSRALNGTGRIAAHNRRRIIEIARDLDYRPGGVPAERRTTTVAVAVEDLTNPFFPELLDGITRAAQGHGIVQLVTGTPDWESLATLRRRQVDGMILVGSGLDQVHLAAVTSGLPVIAVDRPVPLQPATTVRSDHEAGGRTATEHLLGLGHRVIAHLAGPEELQVSRLRLDGYRSALRGAGLDPDPALSPVAGLDLASGRRSATTLLTARPEVTAIVAANDLVAIGALSAAAAAGRRVPADLSVIGFDDIALAGYTQPPLTTIRQHVAQLGQHAWRLLTHKLLGDVLDVTEILPVELVVRDSTGSGP